MSLPYNKNEWWFYPGLRRMMPVPWKYRIPDIKWINPVEQSRTKPVKEVEVTPKTGGTKKKKNQSVAVELF